MLERESRDDGWQVTLRVGGVARFLVAGFLACWLAGWAAGEWFAGGVFLAGLRDLVAPGLGERWLPHMKNAAPANPWPILGFLAVWLAFWTVGGVFAAWQCLRMLLGRDRVSWNHDGVEVEEWAGPFRSVRRLAWSATSHLPEPARGGIRMDARNGRFLVTGMGTPDERRELHAWLADAWREARGAERAAREAATTAPEGWRVETGDDGREVLVRDGRSARGAGVLVLLLGLALAGGAVRVAADAAGAGAKPWFVAAFLGLLALVALAGGAWVLFAREVLAPAGGALRRVRAFAGRTWVEEWTPLELRLALSHDSDGDERWALTASGAGGRGTLAHSLHAPGSAEHLGAWLAARAGVALDRDESSALRLAG